MTFTLTRTTFLNDRTLGTLHLNAKFLCDTLEPTYRGQELEVSKIKGKTAIPCGVYEVVLTRSSRFNKVLPELLNVPFFVGIRIHSGNKPEDTEGCILLGEKSGSVVLNSRKNCAIVQDIISATRSAGERIYLNVQLIK